MDRRIPDVWDIFSLTGPGWTYDSSRRVGSRYDHNGMHTNWTPHARNTQMLMQWCDRSSNCDRPRTYDKFYQKGPSNYHDPSHQLDSMGCSSDTEETFDGPSLPSVDGTSSQRGLRRRRKKGKNSGLQYSRTITESDVRTIERHLSMKKTIRKKIMRDLQQAFVGDPNEFQAPPEAVPPDQRNKINLDNLKFDPKLKDPKFLDLLRGNAEGNGLEQGKAAAVISRLTGRVKLSQPQPKQSSLINNPGVDSLETEFRRRINLNSDSESYWSPAVQTKTSPQSPIYQHHHNLLETSANPSIDGKVIQTKSELRKKKRRRKQDDTTDGSGGGGGGTKKKSSVWSIFSRKQ